MTRVTHQPDSRQIEPGRSPDRLAPGHYGCGDRLGSRFGAPRHIVESARCAPRSLSIAVALLFSVVLFSCPSPAQSPHLSIVQPGGMPGWPVITDIENTDSNRVRITWDGPSGSYQLRSRTSVHQGTWQPVGSPTASRMVEVPATATQAFFRVVGPAPLYAGSLACAECHPGVHADERLTRHARAFATLQHFSLTNVAGGVTNVITGWETTNSCLRCHTVGRNPDPAVNDPLPTGFVSATVTPWLVGVQCENCHGPGALHAANPFDTSVKPRVELAATVCGGCHQSVPLPLPFPQPTLPHYEDWSASGHAEVLPELKEDFEDPIRGASVYIPNCGGCHSGTVRQALLNQDPLPNGHEAGAVGIACITCHDPHRVYVRTNVISGVVTTNQLRNPIASLVDHHTTGAWATNYNPNVNMCAQCHNDRGASWQSSSRPPHHSPQYNMLLGTVGVLEPNTVQRGGRHGREIAGQCVTCHLQTEEYVSESHPADTGHRFDVISYAVCRDCHNDPAGLVRLANGAVTNRIHALKNLLDQWGLNDSRPEIRSYGALAWEYDYAGELSNPAGLDTIRGPVSSVNPALDEQQYVPDNIKKARFNLYLAQYDGSRGVHNARYTVDLLDAATDWVLQEVNPGEALLFELNRLP